MHDTTPPGGFARLTLEQLRAFSAVASHEHVTRAAEALGLSQSAVSHQLKALERALGLEVVERLGRGVRLTADGRSLVPAVTAALGALRSVGEAAAARRGLLAGNLALAASNTVGIYRVPAWLAGFVGRHPQLDVRVRLVNTHDAITLLRDAQADCALVEGPAASHGLERLAVEDDELVVVAAASHPLAQLTQVRSADLGASRYLAVEAGSGTEALAATLLGAAYRSGPVLELGQVDAVRAAALAGLGYAVLPLAAIGDDLAGGRLRQLRVGRPRARRTLTAYRRAGGHSPAVESFWSHLRSLSSAVTAAVAAGGDATVAGE